MTADDDLYFKCGEIAGNPEKRSTNEDL